MSVVRANGVDFHVEDHGSGEPLVLLHGFTGSVASWSSVSHDLAKLHGSLPSTSSAMEGPLRPRILRATRSNKRCTTSPR